MCVEACVKKVNKACFDFMLTLKYYDDDDDDYYDYLSLLRSDAIYSALYDGTGVIEILRGHELLSHPFAVSLFGGDVYWTDWRTNTLTKANKWTGNNVTVIQKPAPNPLTWRYTIPAGSHKVRNLLLSFKTV